MPYDYPTQQMVTALADQHSFDPALFVLDDVLPIDATSFNASPKAIMWDIIAPAKGMTALSALGAEPNIINQRTITTKTASPLYFKDAIRIDEGQLINMRKPGSSTERDGNNMIYRAIDQLQTRIDTRVEVTRYKALTGTLAIDNVTVDYGFTADQKPNVKTTSGYGGQYWDNANAEIRADISKAMEVLKGKGCTKVYMIADSSVYAVMAGNEKFVKSLYGSAYSKSLGVGKNGLASILPDYLGLGITEARISNASYIDDNGNTLPICPDTKLFLVGIPSDGTLGCWGSTPNVYNHDNGGRFLVVSDHTQDELTPHVDVMGGIYGLPVLYQPSCVVCMTVLNEG